ncbi:hypothetical protein WJX74_008708 [Apatococcus lobatus]|uniref:Uncharacterized protein n=1 Tax=Apatococcus lobatus TaxID=904363 RepID=A0AAW1RHG4_9CHLO
MPVGAPPLEPDYVEPEVISWWQKPLRWLQVKWLQYEIFTAATICDCKARTCNTFSNTPLAPGYIQMGSYELMPAADIQLALDYRHHAVCLSQRFLWGQYQ